jgi:hypothetical protein
MEQKERRKEIRNKPIIDVEVALRWKESYYLHKVFSKIFRNEHFEKISVEYIYEKMVQQNIKLEEIKFFCWYYKARYEDLKEEHINSILITRKKFAKFMASMVIKENFNQEDELKSCEELWEKYQSEINTCLDSFTYDEALSNFEYGLYMMKNENEYLFTESVPHDRIQQQMSIADHRNFGVIFYYMKMAIMLIRMVNFNYVTMRLHNKELCKRVGEECIEFQSEREYNSIINDVLSKPEKLYEDLDYKSKMNPIKKNHATMRIFLESQREEEIEKAIKIYKEVFDTATGLKNEMGLIKGSEIRQRYLKYAKKRDIQEKFEEMSVDSYFEFADHEFYQEFFLPDSVIDRWIHEIKENELKINFHVTKQKVKLLDLARIKNKGSRDIRSWNDFYELVPVYPNWIETESMGFGIVEMESRGLIEYFTTLYKLKKLKLNALRNITPVEKVPKSGEQIALENAKKNFFAQQVFLISDIDLRKYTHVITPFLAETFLMSFFIAIGDPTATDINITTIPIYWLAFSDYIASDEYENIRKQFDIFQSTCGLSHAKFMVFDVFNMDPEEIKTIDINIEYNLPHGLNEERELVHKNESPTFNDIINVYRHNYTHFRFASDAFEIDIRKTIKFLSSYTNIGSELEDIEFPPTLNLLRKYIGIDKKESVAEKKRSFHNKARLTTGGISIISMDEKINLLNVCDALLNENNVEFNQFVGYIYQAKNENYLRFDDISERKKGEKMIENKVQDMIEKIYIPHMKEHGEKNKEDEHEEEDEEEDEENESYRSSYTLKNFLYIYSPENTEYKKYLDRCFKLYHMRQNLKKDIENKTNVLKIPIEQKINLFNVCNELISSYNNVFEQLLFEIYYTKNKLNKTNNDTDKKYVENIDIHLKNIEKTIETMFPKDNTDLEDLGITLINFLYTYSPENTQYKEYLDKTIEYYNERRRLREDIPNPRQEAIHKID